MDCRPLMLFYHTIVFLQVITSVNFSTSFESINGQDLRANRLALLSSGSRNSVCYYNLQVIVMFFVGRIGHGFGHGFGYGGHHGFGYGGFGPLGTPFFLSGCGGFHHHHHGAGALLGAVALGGMLGGLLGNLFSGPSQSPMSTALQGPPGVC